jgi:hypothetical protein
MKEVGDKLRDWARAEKTESARDLFGRSALNRYYYSAFLSVRDVLKKLDSKWAKHPHKTMPILIQETVYGRLQHRALQSLRNGLIAPSEASGIQSTSRRVSNELAELLRQANLARVTADYEPETKLVRERDDFLLGSLRLSTAGNWENRAANLAASLLVNWNKLGL